MDLAPQDRFTALRQLLVQRQAALRAEIQGHGQSRRATPVTESHEVTDRKDEAAHSQEIELDSAQEQRDIDEMTDIEAALRRLDAGVYGACADCGEPIAMQRLQVQPAARRCAACQALHEAALHRAGQ